MIAFEIPGEPVAQARARACVVGGHARVYDPKINRDWRGRAQVHMREALERSGRTAPAFTGPVVLRIVATFALPRSRWRKRSPVPTQPHTQRPDLDNVVKAIKDAATGIIWLDDTQVCELDARKEFGAQGQAPSVSILVAAARDVREL